MDKKGIDIKQRILIAAKELFAKKGLEGTSVREICDKAGVNISALSYYFGGKEKMFFALFEAFYPSHKISELERELSDPVHGIQVLIREVIKFRMNDPEMAVILQREIMMQTPRMEELRSFVLPVWSILRRLLIKGREQGLFEFRSLDQTMLYIIATIIFPRSNPFPNPLLTEQPPALEEAIEDTVTFVLNGLSGRKSGVDN